MKPSVLKAPQLRVLLLYYALLARALLALIPYWNTRAGKRAQENAYKKTRIPKTRVETRAVLRWQTHMCMLAAPIKRIEPCAALRPRKTCMRKNFPCSNALNQMCQALFATNLGGAIHARKGLRHFIAGKFKLCCNFFQRHSIKIPR